MPVLTLIPASRVGPSPSPHQASSRISRVSRISRISRVSGSPWGSPTPSFSRKPCVDLDPDGGGDLGGDPSSPNTRRGGSFGFARSFDVIRKATEALQAVPLSRKHSRDNFTAATPDANPAVPVVKSRSRRPTPSLAPVVAPIAARIRFARGHTRELNTSSISSPRIAPHTARGTKAPLPLSGTTAQSAARVDPKQPTSIARAVAPTATSRSALLADGLPPLGPLPSALGSLSPQVSRALPLADPLLERLPPRELLPSLGKISPLAKQQKQPKEQSKHRCNGHGR